MWWRGRGRCWVGRRNRLLLSRGFDSDEVGSVPPAGLFEHGGLASELPGERPLSADACAGLVYSVALAGGAVGDDGVGVNRLYAFLN